MDIMGHMAWLKKSSKKVYHMSSSITNADYNKWSSNQGIDLIFISIL